MTKRLEFVNTIVSKLQKNKKNIKLMKHKITLYQEVYTEVEVESSSQEKAEELVLAGEWDKDNVLDVIVKSSEVVK